MSHAKMIVNLGHTHSPKAGQGAKIGIIGYVQFY